MAGYTIVTLDEVPDVLGDYPGEMQFITYEIGAEQVALTYRRMPRHTGGKGSYGHVHKTQEEIYFVISGTLTFKVGDDVFEAGPQTAVRMTGEEAYSLHNDTDGEAELLIFSTRLADARFEKFDGFWP